MKQKRMTTKEYLAMNAKPRSRAEVKRDYKAAFLNQLLAFQMPLPEREVMFARPRRWRFDFAWIEQKVCAEYQGGIYQKEKSGHTTVKGIEKDCRKFAEAAIRGWILIPFTASMVMSGEALTLVEKALKSRL